MNYSDFKKKRYKDASPSIAHQGYMPNYWDKTLLQTVVTFLSWFLQVKVYNMHIHACDMCTAGWYAVTVTVLSENTGHVVLFIYAIQ